MEEGGGKGEEGKGGTLRWGVIAMGLAAGGEFDCAEGKRFGSREGLHENSGKHPLEHVQKLLGN